MSDSKWQAIFDSWAGEDPNLASTGGLASSYELDDLALQIGDSLEVLVEGLGKLRQDKLAGAQSDNGYVRLLGRTGGDEIVAFDGSPDLVGTIVRVRATRATSLTLFAELEG